MKLKLTKHRVAKAMCGMASGMDQRSFTLVVTSPVYGLNIKGYKPVTNSTTVSIMIFYVGVVRESQNGVPISQNSATKVHRLRF
jgi:hypothetical protein